LSEEREPLAEAERRMPRAARIEEDREENTDEDEELLGEDGVGPRTLRGRDIYQYHCERNKSGSVNIIN